MVMKKLIHICILFTWDAEEVSTSLEDTNVEVVLVKEQCILDIQNNYFCRGE